jgi:hypothetical protein
MKRVVWKYTMGSQDSTFSVPIGAKFRHADLQHGSLTLWLEVSPRYAKVDRRFVAIATGEEFDPSRLEYRATIIAGGGSTVWHVYEEVLQ